MEDKHSPKTGIKKQWKIGIFALVIVAIVGITTYSILTRQTNATDNSSNSFNPTVTVNASTNSTSALAIGDLNWVKNLNTEFVDHDFIFVMFPGNDNDLNVQAANSITLAISKIQAEGIKIDSVTLKQDDPEITTTTELLAISQLPAVIAYNKNGNGALVTGDLDETQLLQAYLVANQVCIPGSGCCPTK